jgi:predicted histone-like DNA-binding protein
MAKILYEVKQNQNSYSQAYGKWYAQIKSLETLNTRKLANHISEHGSIYTPDVVYGVLEKFRSCLVEMLLESKKVKIEGLGTFYCTLENQKNGAAKKEDFNVNKHLKALHIRFLPEQTTEENISSREFLKKAEFINIDSLLKEKEESSSSQSGSGSENSGSGSENSGSGTSSETVTAPEISGTTPFTDSTQVTIQGPQGAEVRYTTNGSEPSAESNLYSEAITLNATTTIKAIAILDGATSEVATKTFTKSGESGGFDLGN